jgi:AAA domain-containing protein
MNNVTQKPPDQARLARVIRGKLDKPIRAVLFATDGLGKSTWASCAPSPIFVGAEDGTAHLDIERMPDVETWEDILASVGELASAAHSYKTVVLDTADWAEPLCWASVARAAKKHNIEDLPYGRGYSAALDQWRLLLAAFERCRARGMHIIVLAHAVIRTFKNPVQEVGDFDRFEMKLHAKASGVIREWADAVLFGTYETFSVADEKTKRVRGVSTGARIIHTQRTAAWDAKNRYDLPPTLPLDWDAFAAAVAAHRPADPANIKARIAAMLEGVSDDELRAKVAKALEAAGDDAARLAKISDNLSARIGIQAQEKAQ